MSQYRVTLHVSFAAQRSIDLMADNHRQAKSRAERQTGLCVLSTELIGLDMELEAINKLYLELSQFASARTQQELCLEQLLNNKSDQLDQIIKELYVLEKLIKDSAYDKAIELINELTIPF